MSGWDFPYEMKREGRYIQKLKFFVFVNFSQKLTYLGIFYDSIRVQALMSDLKSRKGTQPTGVN